MLYFLWQVESIKNGYFFSPTEGSMIELYLRRTLVLKEEIRQCEDRKKIEVALLSVCQALLTFAFVAYCSERTSE